MVAPAARRSRVISCLSPSVMGGTGAGVSAEPPPETRTSRRSSGPADSARARISRAAAAPRSSGTGWPASRSRTLRVGAVYPSFTATTPAAMRSPQISSAAAAMAPEALPAPTTSTRPRGSSGISRRARATSGRTSGGSTGELLQPPSRLDQHVVGLGEAEADLGPPEILGRVERGAGHRGDADLLHEE